MRDAGTLCWWLEGGMERSASCCGTLQTGPRTGSETYFETFLRAHRLTSGDCDVVMEMRQRRCDAGDVMPEWRPKTTLERSGLSI